MTAKSTTAKSMTAKATKTRLVLLTHDQLVARGTINDDDVSVVRASPLAPCIGRAVVAKRRFQCNEIVCSYGGDVLSDEEYRSLLAQHDNGSCHRVAYLAYAPRGWTIDGHPSLVSAQGHAGIFVNDPRGIDGAKSNVRLSYGWCKRSDRQQKALQITLRATRNIKEDDELWLDYGESWWSHKRGTGTCSCAKGNDE